MTINPIQEEPWTATRAVENYILKLIEQGYLKAEDRRTGDVQTIAEKVSGPDVAAQSADVIVHVRSFYLRSLLRN